MTVIVTNVDVHQHLCLFQQQAPYAVNNVNAAFVLSFVGSVGLD